MKKLNDLIGFEWDRNNIDKNYKKHKVFWTECEEVFFNEPIIVNDDETHSIKEKRYYALGRTNFNRKLFIVFTIRGKNIRIISARNMNKKEKSKYEKFEKENSKI